MQDYFGPFLVIIQIKHKTQIRTHIAEVKQTGNQDTQNGSIDITADVCNNCMHYAKFNVFLV